jgi:hypothetical protein
MLEAQFIKAMAALAEVWAAKLVLHRVGYKFSKDYVAINKLWEVEILPYVSTERIYDLINDIKCWDEIVRDKQANESALRTEDMRKIYIDLYAERVNPEKVKWVSDRVIEENDGHDPIMDMPDNW